MEWAQEMHRSEVPFEMLIKTRKGLIHKLEEYMPHMKYNSPYQVKTLLPTANQPQVVDVTVFDFKKQLLSLIHDDFLFGQTSNLDINLEDPFGKYRSNNWILSVTNSGHRYQLAYQTMIKNPKKEFLMPIIFASDETKVSSQGKASCWPLLFTTTVINQSKRNLQPSVSVDGQLLQHQSVGWEFDSHGNLFFGRLPPRCGTGWCTGDCWLAAEQDPQGARSGTSLRLSFGPFPHIVCGFSAWCHLMTH